METVTFLDRKHILLIFINSTLVVSNNKKQKFIIFVPTSTPVLVTLRGVLFTGLSELSNGWSSTIILKMPLL